MENNNFSGLTVFQLGRLTHEYIQRHISTGGVCESDKSINDISRARIESFYKEKGKCFLIQAHRVLINCTNQEYDYTEYTGQKILDHQYDIVLPCCDKELLEMINNHGIDKDNPDEKEVYEWFYKIIERTYVLGGIRLFWS